MAMTDPLGDMLTRIRNGQQAGKATSSTPGVEAARQRARGAEARRLYPRLTSERPATGHAELRIELKYHEGEPVIREIARVSKPGRRVYSKIADLPRVYNGLGISILSTPRGVMSDNEARAANVGGEVLCRVF